ncbi:putative gnat family protein [Botrytis fragariae]|uniref:Putative gnat family protein n=1 Tax=Botrytis fragariae TaxID=1964551 RepID=A0A8H6AQM9_9HELO|nr:putative gnat family protein [Botrytis fragariae]KAF5871812.1 putative gnat family protein [Botrytis fragariae]
MPIHHDPLFPTLTLNSSKPLHQNLILTRPRTSDAKNSIAAFANPAVYLNLTGPPFPYTQDDFDSFFNEVLDKNSRIAAAELWDAKSAQEDGSPVQKWVGAVPFPSIREVRVGEKGERIEEFIGQIDIRRRGFVTTIDEEERKKLAGEHAERKTGDPGIEWEIGFWLLPSHHGRAIMPAVLQTLTSEFFIPYMNLNFLTGEYLEFNKASKRVFEKCGFVDEGITDGVEAIHEGKWEALGVLLENLKSNGDDEIWEKAQRKGWLRGEKVGVGSLRWHREGEVKEKEDGKRENGKIVE